MSLDGKSFGIRLLDPIGQLFRATFRRRFPRQVSCI